MLGRETSRPAGEANIESSSSVLSQGNSFLLCDQDWHRQLPPSALVFLACCWFYCVIFLPMGPIPDFFSKVFGNLFLIPILVASVFWGCSGGDALLLGDICRHVTDRNREPQWFPEVKLPANLCVSVFMNVLFLIFPWLSCDVPAVQITSPSPWYKFQLFTLRTALLLVSQGWGWAVSHGLFPDFGRSIQAHHVWKSRVIFTDRYQVLWTLHTD